MKQLTLIESLELCRDMWAWLAERPLARKFEYFNEHEALDIPEADCYACEYDSQQYTKHTCEACPLNGLWKKECCSDKSPYTLWKKARINKDSEEAKRQAQVIVDFCKAELKRLTQNQNEN